MAGFCVRGWLSAAAVAECPRSENEFSITWTFQSPSRERNRDRAATGGGIVFLGRADASVSAGNICTLACCAGRATHAAGSCMNGTCHTFLTGRSKTPTIHVPLPVHESEKLCGLPQLGTRRYRCEEL
ncbi:MAG: hypothetical protein DMF72_09985 [Acidobacteria bacterium]|nr:MAG: hypothetical protein DMF72_09985 [Acidobacteriota bacterium]